MKDVITGSTFGLPLQNAISVCLFLLDWSLLCSCLQPSPQFLWTSTFLCMKYEYKILFFFTKIIIVRKCWCLLISILRIRSPYIITSLLFRVLYIHVCTNIYMTTQRGRTRQSSSRKIGCLGWCSNPHSKRCSYQLGCSSRRRKYSTSTRQVNSREKAAILMSRHQIQTK